MIINQKYEAHELIKYIHAGVDEVKTILPLFN